MSKLTDNKWAFPLPEFADMEGRRGMTLRQWYAGMALQGLLAHCATISDLTLDQFASDAFLYADAMILHEAGQ
jgi:hypothetical protein